MPEQLSAAPICEPEQIERPGLHHRTSGGKWSLGTYSPAVTAIECASARAAFDEPCPVCQESSALPQFRVDGLDSEVVACPTCGLGRFYPMPTAAQIVEFYPRSYYGSEGRKFRFLTELMVRLVGFRSARFLSRGLTRGARVLDVGCGRGVLLRGLIDHGCEAHGFEISKEAVLGADPRAHIRVAPDLQAADYPDAYFDRVVIWHVLEHVRQPDQTLSEIYRVLKPGGTISVAVPNFSSWQSRWSGPDWFHLDLPRHLYHFPVAALRQLLEQCGFQCQSEHHFSLRQNPFGWVQSALNRWRAGPRNGLYSILHSHANQPHPLLTRLMLLGAFYAGMPVALGMSIMAALCRSGATVHIVAQRPPA